MTNEQQYASPGRSAALPVSAGVVITGDGETATNNHVVSGASSVRATTGDGKEYEAEVVGADSSKDLALIKLEDASGPKAATGRSSPAAGSSTATPVRPGRRTGRSRLTPPPTRGTPAAPSST